jgi:OOP family OmpA-OmpF porin
MQRRSALLAAIVAVLPLAAHAQPITGLYVGAGAGVNIMQNETDKSVNGVATPGKSLEFNVGATGLGSVGWGFGNGLRAEFELDYR